MGPASRALTCPIWPVTSSTKHYTALTSQVVSGGRQSLFDRVLLAKRSSVLAGKSHCLIADRPYR
jgi:hypothetical protein